MAWDSYVYHCLYQKEGVLSNCCESAAILSVHDGHIWACTPNFKLLTYYASVNNEFVLVNESLELAKAAATKQAPNGLRINRQKYLLLRYNETPNSMYIRRKKGGACIAFTEVTLIVATYNERLEVKVATGETFWQNAGVVNERVEELAAFLRKAGF